jgi:hypothetical protein
VAGRVPCVADCVPYVAGCVLLAGGHSLQCYSWVDVAVVVVRIGADLGTPIDIADILRAVEHRLVLFGSTKELCYVVVDDTGKSEPCFVVDDMGR